MHAVAEGEPPKPPKPQRDGEEEEEEEEEEKVPKPLEHLVDCELLSWIQGHGNCHSVIVATVGRSANAWLARFGIQPCEAQSWGSAIETVRFPPRLLVRGLTWKHKLRHQSLAPLLCGGEGRL